MKKLVLLFIILLTISLIKSCINFNTRDYDEIVKIDLIENELCAKLKDSLLVHEHRFDDWSILDIGIAKDSVFGFHFDMGSGFALPLCVGVYKLEDGRILTVEKEGLIASIKKDTLVLENK